MDERKNRLGSQKSGATLDKGRMEGFTDGVLGFAITLLVVNIASPTTRLSITRVLPHLAVLFGVLGQLLYDWRCVDRAPRPHGWSRSSGLHLPPAESPLPPRHRIPAVSHPSHGGRVGKEHVVATTSRRCLRPYALVDTTLVCGVGHVCEKEALATGGGG
jgi:hypothetical protein